MKHLIVIGATTEKIVAPYLTSNTKVHLVPNFVDIEKSDRVEAEKNSTFAFVGRFSPEKDPVTAAMATYMTEVPMMFIGTGPLVDEIRFTNPEANMRGWQKPSEVKTMLREARGIIFPSVWYEGQPLVIDEAAAMGLPVIISDVSAAVDSVNRYRHGLTFEAGNLDALVRRLKEFAHDDVVKSLSVSGYETYWQNPSTMDLHISQLMRVYDKVLSDSE